MSRISSQIIKSKRQILKGIVRPLEELIEKFDCKIKPGRIYNINNGNRNILESACNTQNGIKLKGYYDGAMQEIFIVTKREEEIINYIKKYFEV